MNGYMYILECANGSYYTGSTTDLERRLQQHQSGQGANHTKKHLPVKLVYYETFQRIDDAFYREKQIQGWSRRKKEALINGRLDLLVRYSKSVASTGSATGGETVAMVASAGSATGSETMAMVASASSATGSETVPEPLTGA